MFFDEEGFVEAELAVEIPVSCFGKSAHIDLYGVNVDDIDDPEYIEDVMNYLIDFVLDMKRFGTPFIQRFGSGRLSGYSYAQMIETSCVTAHFAPATLSCYIDVFSCKNFNERIASLYLRKQFNATHGNCQVLIRD